MCPINRTEKQTDYFLGFDTEKALVCSVLDKNGLASGREKREWGNVLDKRQIFVAGYTIYILP